MKTMEIAQVELQAFARKSDTSLLEPPSKELDAVHLLIPTLEAVEVGG